MAGAEALNAMRYNERVLVDMRYDTTTPSRAAVMAPAEGPNSRAEAMLKTSEIEKLIGMPGMRSVAQPLAMVSAMSTAHSRPTGRVATLTPARATTQAPARITHVT